MSLFNYGEQGGLTPQYPVGGGMKININSRFIKAQAGNQQKSLKTSNIYMEWTRKENDLY